MTVSAAVLENREFNSEEQGRRFWGSRRLRTALAYGVVAVALGLAVTDVCRLAVAPEASARQQDRIH